MSEITHVALAFMRSSTFNTRYASEWPLFTTVEAVRPQFANGTAIMVAIGGWSDTTGFCDAAATESSRKLFARNVKAMVEHTGADGKLGNVSASEALIANQPLGVDIDWEYPG